VNAAIVEIVIKGRLSDPVAALIEGFRVSCVDRGETNLVGPVLDQAKLQGILTLFANLNIDLISVNPLSDP
jgi:hypothetical protein